LAGNPIQGATSNFYVAQSAGEYTVSVKDSNGCSATNSINYLSIENLAAGYIQVYPNPSTSGWQLLVDNNLVGAEMEIFDASGRSVFKTKIVNSHTDIAFDAASGIYLLRINALGNILIKKLVKL
jgi:hypothetical protein